MDENRRFARLNKESEPVSVICGGVKENVKVLDVSAGGMRVNFGRQVEIGTELDGKLQVDPLIGPFFVKGRVMRVNVAGSGWEAAVKFVKVSTLPIIDAGAYQLV